MDRICGFTAVALLQQETGSRYPLLRDGDFEQDRAGAGPVAPPDACNLQPERFPMKDTAAALEQQGWMPEGEVAEVLSVDLSVGGEDHPFEVAERDRIAANWQVETAANPALYNGRLVLFSSLSFDGGHVRGDGHMVDFSTFLWWRKQPGGRQACHTFSMAVPVSRDGAIIAIRMARNTANPGMVYCAAGSLDAHDIIDGRCDIALNMAREVREETGLDLGEARADPVLFASHDQRRVSLFRFFHFDLDAEDMLDRIARHMLQDHEKEIEEAIAIRSPAPDLHPYSSAMFPILKVYFNRNT
jgi:8-oxo-dGTP pyrophosphatase MutT (NUDIX family)